MTTTRKDPTSRPSAIIRRVDLLAAIGLSLVGSGGGVLLASPLLLLGRTTRVRVVPDLISYAVGTLLGVALLKLVPEALESVPAAAALGALLAGILTFFMLEKLVLWRHCHTDDCHAHETSATLILIGGGLHTFTDGAIVGAAVLTSLPLGLTTAVAVAAHQIPQEVGDFAILLDAGYSRSRAFVLNALSASTCMAGAVAVYVAASAAPNALPYVLAFAAGSFLYVAMSDLIPGLHREAVDVGAGRQVLMIALGVGTIVLL